MAYTFKRSPVLSRRCKVTGTTPTSPPSTRRTGASEWSRRELTDEGQSLTLGVELAHTGELVGDVILFWHSRLHSGGELGYVLNPDFAGQGYATEAANAMLRLGFEELGLHRVVARIDERNEPSARLARRLGLRQEARLVHNELFKGEWSNELDFAMLAQEWPAHRKA